MNLAIHRISRQWQVPTLRITRYPHPIPRPFLRFAFSSISVKSQQEPDLSLKEHAPPTTSENSSPVSSTRQESRLARRQRRVEAGLLRSNRLIDVMKHEASSHTAGQAQVGSTRDQNRRVLKGRHEQPLKESRTKARKKDGVRRLARMAKFAVPNGLRPSRESQSKSDGSRSLGKSSATLDTESQDVPQWITRKRALKDRLQDGEWRPTKRLSPSTVEGIRALYEAYGDRITLPMLSKHFKISYEAMRRILKSKSWHPTAEQMEDRQERWERRGERIWTKLADKGLKPPKQWRMKGVGANGPDAQVPQWRQDEWGEKNVEELLKNPDDSNIKEHT
jgi:hypothetical protein